MGRTVPAIKGALYRFNGYRKRLDFWSEQDVTKLEQLWPLHSAGVIAKMLGRTRNAVIGQINRRRVRDGIALKAKTTRFIQNELPRPIPTPPRQRSKQKARVTKVKPSPAPSIQCHCQLVELEDINCKWPFGDPKETGFYFCGAIRFDGSPYCSEHTHTARNEGPYIHVRDRTFIAKPVYVPPGCA
jgi:GcrA cell cycle regulator